MNQFVNEQLFRYMQHVLKPLHLNCNLLKFKGVKDSQLDPKNPGNTPMQTNQENG